VNAAFAVIGAGALVTGGIVMATAGPAAAHTPQGWGDCDGVTAKATSYGSQDENTVTVTLDGVVVEDTQFDTGFTKTYEYATNQSTHTWKVEIRTTNDEPAFSKTFEGTATGCDTVPEPEPKEWTDRSDKVDCYAEEVVTTITTTTVGWVWDTSKGKWVEDEPKVTTDTESRPATAEELNKAECDGPGEPESKVTTESSERLDCVDEEMVVTTTTTTTPWNYDKETRTWVEGEPEVTEDVERRPATKSELEAGGCVEEVRGPTEAPTAEPTERTPSQPAATDEPEALPTVVDAGTGPGAGNDGPWSGSVGLALSGAGLLMLLFAGALQIGRRGRGAHEA
jgi:hypothetical protein